MTKIRETEPTLNEGPVIFSPKELEHMILVGRGLRHRQIADIIESCPGTASSQALVRKAILRAGFITDTQTVVYAVKTGQVTPEEIFKSPPPEDHPIDPKITELQSSQMAVLPFIARGPFTHSVPGMKAQSVVSKTHEVRKAWGLNSNSQVVLTAIDRRHITFDDALSERRYSANPGDLDWNDLTESEQSIVASVWEGRQLKEYLADLKITASGLTNQAFMLRERVTAENNFQLGLEFFERSEFSPEKIAESIDLYAYMKLEPGDYKILEAHIKNRGINFRNPAALTHMLKTTEPKLKKARDKIRQKVRGVQTFEQVCLFYIYAKHVGLIEIPSRKTGKDK